MDKSIVLNYLTDIGDSDKFLIGQNTNWNMANIINGYEQYIETLYQSSGKYPAIIGANYGGGATIEEIHAGNQLLIEYWNSGGLITLFHPANNPWTDGNRKDLTSRNHIELIDENSSVYSNWINQLNKIAIGLKELQDNGVVVLWRPFHEMTFRHAFWWDCGAHWPDVEPYKAMWRHMHNYFTTEKQLNNLLWVYCSADQDTWRDADICYPGDDYVDIVGVDIYSDNIQANGNPYDKLTTINKPFSIPECGPGITFDGSWDNLNIINSLMSDYPKTAYFLVWHSWTNHKVGIIDNQNATELMNHPNIICLGDIQMGEDLNLKADELELKAIELENIAQILRDDAQLLRNINTEFQQYDSMVEQLASDAKTLSDVIN